MRMLDSYTHWIARAKRLPQAIPELPFIRAQMDVVARTKVMKFALKE